MGRFRRGILFLALAAVLPSCGGSSSSGGVVAPASQTLTGTAAKGAPIANAAIEAKDRNGTLRSGTTSASGTFSLDVTGLTEPFLLKVTPVSGPALFSVGSQAGVVALTPLTDMVIRNYYRARNLVLDTVYGALNSASPVPTAAEVDLVSRQVRDLIAQWLQAQGIDPDGFDLMTVAFNADGTGFDAVLDLSTVTDNGTTTSLGVVSGTVTQSTTVTADGGTGTMASATTSTDSGSSGVTQSEASTLVPFATGALAALTGVNASLELFRQAVNAGGSSLTAAQIAPYMDDNLIHEGTNKTQQSAEVAAYFRGVTILSLKAGRIYSYDSVNEIIDVDMAFSYTSSGGGGTSEDALRMLFRKSGSSWLMYGNRELVSVGVQVEMVVNNFGTPDPKKKINVDIRAIQGTIQTGNVTIHCPSDPTLFNNDNVPSGGTEIVTYRPTTASADDFTETWDVFFHQRFPTSHPAPGTVFEVTVTPVATGTPVTYTVVSGATTTETTSLTPSIAGNTIANLVGNSLDLTWTLPTTFLVVNQEFSLHLQNANNEQMIIDPAVAAGPSSTSGSLGTVPTQFNGSNVTRATINVNHNGRNGERIIHLYTYQ